MSWIALTLVIFGSWHPLRVVAGAYLLGMLQLLGCHFQDSFPAVPAQIFQVAPWQLMILTLLLINLGSNRRTQLMRLFGSKPPK